MEGSVATEAAGCHASLVSLLTSVTQHSWLISYGRCLVTFLQRRFWRYFHWNPPPRQSIFTWAGPICGRNAGKTAIQSSNIQYRAPATGLIAHCQVDFLTFWKLLNYRCMIHQQAQHLSKGHGVWSCHGACCSNPLHLCRGKAAPELQADFLLHTEVRYCSAGWNQPLGPGAARQATQKKGCLMIQRGAEMLESFQKDAATLRNWHHERFLLQTSSWLWTSVSGQDRQTNYFVVFLWRRVINRRCFSAVWARQKAAKLFITLLWKWLLVDVLRM